MICPAIFLIRRRGAAHSYQFTLDEAMEVMGALGHVASAEWVDETRTEARITYTLRDTNRQPVKVSV